MLTLDPQQIVFAVGIGLFTLTAAVCDWRTRRIPNRLTIPVFFLGLVYQVAFNGPAGLGDAGLGFAVGFGTLFVLWMIGGGGGGDVKLMGALSVWLGFHMTLLVMISSTVFVLFGTLAVMVWSLVSRGPYKTKKKFIATGKPRAAGDKAVPETVEQRKGRRIMAYAIPVTLATWLVVIWKLPTL